MKIDCAEPLMTFAHPAVAMAVAVKGAVSVPQMKPWSMRPQRASAWDLDETYERSVNFFLVKPSTWSNGGF
jgi:hypothetical protein